MPNNFEAHGYGESSDKTARRRRRRRGGSSSHDSGRSLTPTPVVTSQPQTTYSTSSDTLAASVLGTATIASTLTAAAIGTTAPASGTGAISAATAGALGAATNITVSSVVASAASQAITTAVAAAFTGNATLSTENSTSLIGLISSSADANVSIATTDIPHFSSPTVQDAFILSGISAASVFGVCACFSFIDRFCQGLSLRLNRVLGFVPQPPAALMRFFVPHYPDSGYGSSESIELVSLSSSYPGDLDRCDILIVEGVRDSLNSVRGDGGEGPSRVPCTYDGEDCGLHEVVVTQPGGGNYPMLRLGGDSSSDSSSGGSRESLLGAVGGDGHDGLGTRPGGSDSDSDRQSVRETLLGATGGSGDTNRGPGGKCKKKLRNLER